MATNHNSQGGNNASKNAAKKTKTTNNTLYQMAVFLLIICLPFGFLAATVSADNATGNQTTGENNTAVVCTNDETQACVAMNECPGVQICINGTWSKCNTNLKQCIDGNCKEICPESNCTDECNASYCAGNVWHECVLGSDNCYKDINRGQVEGRCNANTDVVCAGEDTKCISTTFFECQNNKWQNLGEIPGKCGYTKPNTEENNKVNEPVNKPTNTNRIAPHFDTKAMDADDNNPGLFIVQITNPIGNSEIEAQIILSIPDNVEVSDGLGFSGGKAAYTSLPLYIDATGQTYVEVSFNSRNPGTYRMSPTIYWYWKGDDKIQQIGLDKSIFINSNERPSCVKRANETTCKPITPVSQNPGNNDECQSGWCWIPHPNLILLIIVSMVGIAVIIALRRRGGKVEIHEE